MADEVALIAVFRPEDAQHVVFCPLTDEIIFDDHQPHVAVLAYPVFCVLKTTASTGSNKLLPEITGLVSHEMIPVHSLSQAAGGCLCAPCSQEFAWRIFLAGDRVKTVLVGKPGV